MRIHTQTADFLPAKTELIVSVDPSGDVSPELLTFLDLNIAGIGPDKTCFIRLQLIDDLAITFKLFDRGNQKRELNSCRCFVPALPDENIRSLNEAYQKISSAFEKGRRSVGGSVYNNIYHCTKLVWRPLAEHRDEIFKNYQDEFEQKTKELLEREKSWNGIQIPNGVWILIRKDPKQPFIYYPQQLSRMLDVERPFSEDENLFSFGPLSEEKIWDYTRRLQNSGFVYGSDFVQITNSLPEWCCMKVFPVKAPNIR